MKAESSKIEEGLDSFCVWERNEKFFLIGKRV